MIFNSSAVAFGRNETFSLRYNWIYKGLSALKENKDIFTSPDALQTLGVGKNMMISMKYWLSAYQLVEKTNSSEFTEFASYLLDPEKGKDPYLEDINTLWLLHWKLCTNPDLATMYYWFFNKFTQTTFSKLQVLNELSSWLEHNTTKSVSQKTLERDVSLLLKAYLGANTEDKAFEDQLENPFHELNLVSKNASDVYNCFVRDRETIDFRLLGFFIADIQEFFTAGDMLDKPKNFKQIPVSQILNSDEFPSIQKIFKTTEDSLYISLEQLEHAYPDLFKISDTVGQKSLFILQALKPYKFLDDFFKANK
jgi:hypothetical protein